MDYPKSVPGVGLVNGKFVDENKATGQAGSLIPGVWGNALTDEIVNVEVAAGLLPNEMDNTQLLQGIRILIGQASLLKRFATVPTVRGDDEIYVRGRGEMVWVETAYFVGYRSPHCGRPVDGHTILPLTREIDAVGGLLSKTDYAGLWGYAQEQGLVVTQGVWTANVGAHYFVNVSGTQFRVPDLRNMFRRFTGTDADTANARGMGSHQIDAFKTHAHAQNVAAVMAVGGSLGTAPANISNSQLGGNTSSNGGPETRPVNTAYAPRLHI